MTHTTDTRRMHARKDLLLRALLLGALGSMSYGVVAPRQAHAVIIDGVAARINAEIITLYDVRKAATPFMLQRGMDPQIMKDPARRTRVYHEVLDDLIERKLLVQEAAKLGLTVSDEEVDQWMAYTRQQQGLSEEQMRATIKQYGMSYADYRDMVRQNLLRMNITKVKVGGKVSVSDAEVEARYRERYGTTTLNDRYITVQHLLVQPEADSDAAMRVAYERALKLRDEVAQGGVFEDVARRESDGPSSKKGGRLGTFRRGELDADFEEAAFKLEINELSQPVLTKFGYHIIVVTSAEERANPDIAERKDAIRGELRQVAAERQLTSYIKGLRERAFVEVKM